MYILIQVLNDGKRKELAYYFDTIKEAREKSEELTKNNAIFVTWLMDDVSNMSIQLDSLV